MGIALVSSFAQKGKVVKPIDTTIISQDKLPAEVAKAFKKRFAAATDVVWHSKGSNLLVECMFKNVPTEAIFQKDGTWLSTEEDLETSMLPPACVKSLDAYFNGKYTLASFKRKTESNKDVTMIVGVYEPQNLKKKLETKIWLDKMGVIIRTLDPEETPAAVETPPAVSEKKQAKEEAKAKKELDKDRRLEIYPLKISEKELPSSMVQWISLRYPDYVYKEIVYTEDPQFEDEGNLYRIKMQRSGVGQGGHSTLWFTRDGNFLKVDDPQHTEEELNQIAKNAVSTDRSLDDPKAQRAKNNEKTKPAEVVKTPRMVTDEDDVPKDYLFAFKQKFPKQKEVSWGEYDEEWTAYYTDQNGKNEVSFYKTDSVRWLETKTPLADLTRIPASVRTYIDENHSKLSIKGAWTVKSAQVKPYIVVEMFDKKERTTQNLEFWQTGKLKSDIIRGQAQPSTPVKTEPKFNEEGISESGIPQEYHNALRLKYPRTKVTWVEEDGDFTAFFTDQNGQNEIVFERVADSVQWLETKTPMADLTRIPASVRTFTDSKYPKHVIKAAWTVKSAKVKPYIIVELYSKKEKSTETLEFWQTGKRKE